MSNASTNIETSTQPDGNGDFIALYPGNLEADLKHYTILIYFCRLVVFLLGFNGFWISIANICIFVY